MIMIRPTSLVASLLLVAAGLPAITHISHAQPAPPGSHKTPSQKDIDAARKHFQSAEAAKARGEYQTAAVEYLAAYELFEEPAFFYDTAEVYRLAGDEKNALVYYTKYLELAPGGQAAPAAHTAADQLRRSIAAKEDAARRAADDEARRKAADDAKRKTAQQASPAPAQAATHNADDADRPVAGAGSAAIAPGRGMRIAGMATGGAGVVALGIGVAFGLKAQSLSNEASRWSTFDQKRYDQGKAAERNMFVFTGIGAAALVTGGVLYYLGHRAGQSAEASAVTIAPGIASSQATLTVAGSF